MKVRVRDLYYMRTPMRVMYGVFNDGLTGAFDVVTMCRTRNCCNPKHLGVRHGALAFVATGAREVAA